jgi:protein phosphatase
VVPDISSFSVYPEDRVLLCSDGLTNAVEDGEIEATLQDDANLHSACDRLVSLGIARGGNDNLTTVLCKF